MACPTLNPDVLQHLLRTNLVWSFGILSVLAAIKVLRLQNVKTIYHFMWLCYCLLIPVLASHYVISNSLKNQLSSSIFAEPARQVIRQVAGLGQELGAIDVVAGMLSIGVAVSLLSLILRIVALQTSRRRLAVCTDSRVLNLLAALRTHLGLTRTVTCLIGPDTGSPFSTGFLRPAVVIPTNLLDRASQQSLRLVLTHELIHIKNHDFLKNLLQKVLRSLLFFNPVVLFIDRYIDKMREMSCDRDVIACFPGETKKYAETILRLNLMANQTENSAVIHFSQHNSNLRRRIMKMNSSNKRDKLTSTAAAGLVVLAFAVVLSCAQDTTISPPEESVQASQTKRATVTLHLPMDAEALESLPPELQERVMKLDFDFGTSIDAAKIIDGEDGAVGGGWAVLHLERKSSDGNVWFVKREEPVQLTSEPVGLGKDVKFEESGAEVTTEFLEGKVFELVQQVETNQWIAKDEPESKQ